MKNYLLQIETATFDGSVAISENDKTLKRLWLGQGEKHIGTLAPNTKLLLNTLNLKPTDLKAIAISIGPGSYTGLRIGLSFAKGLATALTIPIIAIPTLEIIAKAIENRYSKEVNAVPLLDARRMEVYTAWYFDGLLQKEVEPLVIDEHSFSFLRNQKTVFAGNGSEKCRDLLKNEHWIFDTEIKLDAENMATLAFDKFEKGIFDDSATCEPFYLKEFALGKASAKILAILTKASDS